MDSQININAEDIARQIICQMKESGRAIWIDPETHSAQHEFISEMIAERRERAERRKRIEEKIAGSLVLSAIVALIALLGSGALNWIHKG